MEHIAILNKQKKLLEKIISGEKTIESRWLVNKSVPWGKVKPKETIYFKDSGDKVSVKAIVQDVLYFYLPQANMNELFDKYGLKIGFHSLQELKSWCVGKNYCVLIFLETVEKITPFDIDKTGYGVSTAWIVTESVEKMKK